MVSFHNVFPACSAPTEPLLCKFADGGQKKRQNPNKYIPNGRPWHREGEVRLVSPFLKLQCGCAVMAALKGHTGIPLSCPASQGGAWITPSCQHVFIQVMLRRKHFPRVGGAHQVTVLQIDGGNSCAPQLAA